MVTFANVGSVRLPYLLTYLLNKFEVRRPPHSEDTAHSVSAVYLQQFPSYSNHNCKKIVIFTYPGLHFLFALGTLLRQSRKTLHEWKDTDLPNFVYLLSILRLRSLLLVHNPSHAGMHIKTLIDWIDCQVSTMATNVVIFLNTGTQKLTSQPQQHFCSRLHTCNCWMGTHGSRGLWLRLTLGIRKDSEAPGDFYFVDCIMPLLILLNCCQMTINC